MTGKIESIISVHLVIHLDLGKLECRSMGRKTQNHTLYKIVGLELFGSTSYMAFLLALHQLYNLNSIFYKHMALQVNYMKLVPPI